MGLRDLTGMLSRRWYLALPLLLATVGVAWWAAVAVGPAYTATAYVRLVPPADEAHSPSGNAPHNLWLDLGLGPLSTAVTRTTMDNHLSTLLVKQGLSTDVSLSAGYPASIITIRVVGDSRQQAARTADQVVVYLERDVSALQTDYGVKPTSLITSQRLDHGEHLAESNGKVIHTLIAVAAVGLLLTTVTTVGFDVLLRRRSRLRNPYGSPGSSRHPGLAGGSYPATSMVGAYQGGSAHQVVTAGAGAWHESIPVDQPDPAFEETTVIIPLSPPTWWASSPSSPASPASPSDSPWHPDRHRR